MATIKANYGAGETIKHAIFLLYTRLFWARARLIRMPFRIRGRSGFQYGSGFTVGYSCRIEIGGDTSKRKLIIGDNCIIGDYAHIVSNYSVQIGNDVLMASRVFISDTSHGNYRGSDEDSLPSLPPNKRKLSFSRITIGNNVWLGENVAVLQGANIGNGCIIGANSVVTRDIPDNCIAVGIPAKVIKYYNITQSKWERIPEYIPTREARQ